MQVKELINIVKEYYPDDLDFWEFESVDHLERQSLKKVCDSAIGDIRWIDFKEKLLYQYNFIEFSLLFQAEPGFIGSIIVNQKNLCQLIVKISVIAPVYTLYFFYDHSDHRRKTFRFNASNKEEGDAMNLVFKTLKSEFSNYTEFAKEGFFTTVENLGNLRLRHPRKPYLDECIFGTYMSIHT